MDSVRPLNLDAWSDGQLRSKLWLCQELESNWRNKEKPATLWIFGSWYGTLAQMLLIRERMQIRKFELFDIDQQAIDISSSMTGMWWINRMVEFDFHVIDCARVPAELFEERKPDLVINTSCEHFRDYEWFHRLPKGQKFLVQSTNMKHPTHVLCPESLEDFKARLGPGVSFFYEGALPFNYPNMRFERYMLMGQT